MGNTPPIVDIHSHVLGHTCVVDDDLLERNDHCHELPSKDSLLTFDNEVLNTDSVDINHDVDYYNNSGFLSKLDRDVFYGKSVLLTYDCKDVHDIADSVSNNDLSSSGCNYDIVSNDIVFDDRTNRCDNVVDFADISADVYRCVAFDKCVDNSVSSCAFDSYNAACPSFDTYVSDVLCDDTVDYGYCSDTIVNDVPNYNKFVYDFPLVDRVVDQGCVGGLYSQLKPSAWLHEMQWEDDNVLSDFISNGVLNGFKIVNDDAVIEPYHCRNYRSVLEPEAFNFVNDLLLSEIEDTKYVHVVDQPLCVHSLGAIPKPDMSFRPITDCRQPLNYSVNNFMDQTALKFTYSTVDRVASFMTRDCYMATVDISSAYRTVSIYPSNRTFQGIQWNFGSGDTFLTDTRLSFGTRSAPYIFTQLTNFVVRCLNRRGYKAVVSYLDDFVVMGQTLEECQQAHTALLTLLGTLGFSVSWKKCQSSSRRVKYLGVIFDSAAMSLTLPQDKLDKLRNEMIFFKNRRFATKHQLQKLVGLLCHCSKLIKGGRTFSHRVIMLLKGLPEGNPRITLTQGFKLDLHWWRCFMDRFNGTATYISYNYGQGPVMFTDASMNGYGCFSGTDWCAGYFNSNLTPLGYDNLLESHSHWVNVKVKTLKDADDNINLLELCAVMQGVRRFARKSRNCHLVVYTDNSQVLSMVNKGFSINVTCMQLIRELLFLCAVFNIHLTARFISGKSNYLADLLSRVHALNDIKVLTNYMLCCSYGMRD